MKYYKWLSYVNSILWIVLCFLIIGSSVLGPEYFLIHFIVGSVFFAAGTYFYLKTKTVLQLLNQEKYNEADFQSSGTFQRFVLFENILIIGAISIVILLLCGILSRILSEGKAVFG
ncbi:hypothetical protein TH53_22630 [Pedobacter lusitanus]|uniref:Uncharacterized protein n=1 Tax=Pedobacter lusitanus TaxID=1503925 RepID=A0A0D0GFY6_9SPHI|nr:hypothetical protein [Pedobacter lusitanus]KIO75055.1 hypothetical protein TH53_22630 [Pedobacter lusitanus]